MIPERLIKMRRKYNLSKRELGKKLNITSVTIGMYESGKLIPNREMLKNLATVLHCTTDYLLGISDSPYILKLTDEKSLFDFNIVINELVTFSNIINKVAPFSSFRNAQIIISKFELLAFAMNSLYAQTKINNNLTDFNLGLAMHLYKQLSVNVGMKIQLSLKNAVLKDEQRKYLQQHLENINYNLHFSNPNNKTRNNLD